MTSPRSENYACLRLMDSCCIVACFIVLFGFLPLVCVHKFFVFFSLRGIILWIILEVKRKTERSLARVGEIPIPIPLPLPLCSLGRLIGFSIQKGKRSATQDSGVDPTLAVI